MRLKLLSIIALLGLRLIVAEFDDRYTANNASNNESKLGIWWAPIVNTTGGFYQGYTYQSLNYYLGIPYAEPPVKDLRFSPPVPKQPVDQSVNGAYWYGSICPQQILGSIWLGHEDCLYLNVYAPKQEEQSMVKKPVFVWIYGGSFVFGDGWEFGLYEASNFVKTNDVIVVTFNYRLGPLGFMNGPGISGNAGLMDQRLALQWVHDNIERFGGDPNQVTIGGESAGAMSVCSQLAHQLHLMKESNDQSSKQLFHGVIMQSGTCDSATFWPSLASSVDWSVYYAEMLGCPYNQSSADAEKSFLKCLRSLPVDVFVKQSKSKDQSSNPAVDYDDLDILKKQFDPSVLHPIDESLVESPDDQSSNLVNNHATLKAIAKLHMEQRDQSKLESVKQSLKQSSSQLFEVNPPPLPILYPAVPWTPVVDGDFLPDNPLNIIESTYQPTSLKQSVKPLPVLIGTNLDEGTLFIRQLYAILPDQLHDPLFESDLPLIYQHVFGESAKNQSKPVIEQIQQHYPPSDYQSINQLVEAVLRDYIFTCPSRRLLKTIYEATEQSRNESTWLYQYRYNPGWIDNAYLGVYHSAELEFVFGNEWPPLIHMFDSTDRQVVQLINEKWGNFIKYGHVNGQASNQSVNSEKSSTPSLEWPAWNPSTKLNLVIDHPPSIEQNLLGEVCEFWDSVDQIINQAVQQQKHQKLQAIKQANRQSNNANPQSKPDFVLASE